jgi:uncharacterized protein (UPF0147 family)
MGKGLNYTNIITQDNCVPKDIRKGINAKLLILTDGTIIN